MLNSTAKSVGYEKNRNADTDKINFTFLGMLAFVCGFPSLYVLNLMGELYATEIILPVIAIILIFSGKGKRIFKERIFWRFVLSVTVLMIGYIISDLVAGTSQANYLRGWGRNAILFSDIVSLSIMAATDKRYLWWYIFGVSLGSIIYLHSTGIPFTGANWKLSYSQPIFLLMLIAAYFIPNVLTVYLVAAIGVFSFYMDSRSFSSMCILLAGILWIRQGNPETFKITKIKGLVKVLVAGGIAIWIIMSIMAKTQEDFGNRREVSSLGRYTALRIGLIAISDSPILGFGSWGEGTKEYAAMLYKETVSKGRELGQSNTRQGTTFLAHSQILQSWMEGGILAAQLFMYYGYQILATLKKIIFSRRFDYMTQFYCFLLFGSFWGVFMSPYSGGHRLGVAITVAIICAVNIEMSKEKQ